MTNRPPAMETAEQALADGDWAKAREAFVETLEVAETAEALEGLSEALWWLAEVPAAVEFGERAYAAYRRRGDAFDAADVALSLALWHRSGLGNDAAATGWLARARALVDDHQLDVLRGWVLLREAEFAGAVAGEALARQACELARQQGDSDLELCAVSEIGAKVIEQGRVGEGMAYLDEAMAGSLGGEGETPLTVVYASCNTVKSCASCATFERAIQWIRAADRFTRRFGCPFLFARCRTLYGAVLVAVGDWVQAEEELEIALRLSRDALPSVHADALAGLAELRLAQGNLEEAERLIEGLVDQRTVVAVAARIQLERLRPASAEAMLRRWLSEFDEAPLESAVLHELLGEAELAQGRAEEAADRGRALADAGARLGCDVAIARGERLYAQALATTAGTDGARPHFDRALVAFAQLHMPVEAARTRLQLGRLLAAHAPEVASEELRRALDTFDSLGAGRDADAAARLLRDLGVKVARTGPRGLVPLSPREREVLALLGEGLSNPEIAERLYISRRTVEHHVARVLDKLGVRSRGEAIAYAARHGGGTDAVRAP